VPSARKEEEDQDGGAVEGDGDLHQSEAVEVGMAFEHCLYHVCSHFGISDPFEFTQGFELWECGSEYTLDECSVYRKEE